jgi:hypothetical protein
VFEHALVMYLHGRAMEGVPATLHYALPEGVALTAEAEPYWFDATTEHRAVGGAVAGLPGHRHVTVELSGLDAVPDPLFPPPDDRIAPDTTATVTPAANEAGWNHDPVVLDLTATDDVAGVREVRAQVRDITGPAPDQAWITPGDRLALPFPSEGEYEVTFAAVDRLGNVEAPEKVRVRVDLTAPTITGMPSQPCRIWPPNERMVQVADAVTHDVFSGVADLEVDVTVDEPAAGDVVVVGGVVLVRAFRDDQGDGRVYTISASATDLAGNGTRSTGQCVVPHDRRP